VTLRLGAIFDSLADEFEATLFADADTLIDKLAPIEAASLADLSFLSHPKYLNKLATSNAACVIVSPAMEDAALARGGCIVVADPYRYFARVTQVWKQHHEPQEAARIHPSAVIDPSAQLGEGVSVAAFVCIAAGAVIGVGARLGEHCVIGRDAVVGAHSRLSPRVTLGDRCKLGERCILHAGVVIGSDGFGFAPHAGRWEKIEQLGAVRIGNDVEIGANTCLDRGALDDTVIEDGVKLDNLIQIGHNVHIGQHTAMAGCVGVAGSANIGAHCTIGGGAVVLGHLRLADHVNVSASSVVTRSILKPGHYSGFFPIDDNAAWEKNAATLKQLHTLRDRLKQVEKQITQQLQEQTEEQPKTASHPTKEKS
jgi:UDP-3-O-[3-hydroxymyristoyl] glucosamine N-acyltransferase